MLNDEWIYLFEKAQLSESYDSFLFRQQLLLIRNNILLIGCQCRKPHQQYPALLDIPRVPSLLRSKSFKSNTVNQIQKMQENASSAYTPLQADEIRLLTLFPSASPEATVQCKLHHSGLDGRPTYEALSYAWGIEIDSEPISVNQLNFAVTQNLRLALQ